MHQWDFDKPCLDHVHYASAHFSEAGGIMFLGCPSVRLSVRPSVCPSVRLTVCPSVTKACERDTS